MSELEPITREEWFLYQILIKRGGGGDEPTDAATVGSAVVGTAKVG